MRNEERIMLSLLREIDQACIKARCNYYLIDHELLSFVRDKRVYNPEADICMLYRDYKKIEPVLKRTENRVIESIDNNIDMPGAYYRYVKSDSLMLQLSYHKVRKAHGICVNIHIIRKDDESAHRLAVLEGGMRSFIEGKDNLEDLSNNITNLKKKGKIYVWKINRMLEKASLKNTSSSSMLVLPEFGELRFSGNFWNQIAVIETNHGSFSTMRDYKTYLSARFGDDYLRCKVINPLDHYQILVDISLPYDTVIDDIMRNEELDDEFWTRRNRFLKNYYWDIKDMENKEKEIWDVMFLTEDRFYLWKKYYWRKKELQEMCDAGRYDELYLVLSQMDKRVANRAAYGHLPIFDNDIWRIYLEVLKKQHRIDDVERYQQLIESNPIEELKEEDLKEYENILKRDSITIRNIQSDN